MFGKEKIRKEIDQIGKNIRSAYKDAKADPQSTEAASLAGFNRQLVDAYAQLETGSILDRLVYSKITTSLKDVYRSIPESIRTPDNRQIAVIVPKTFYQKYVMEKAKAEYDTVTLAVTFKEWLKNIYNPAKGANKKLTYKQFLSDRFGDGIVPGSGSDLGIIIPKYYNNGTKPVGTASTDGARKIKSQDLKKILTKYPGLSLKELNCAYLISANKEISTAKVGTEAIATIAGITFAYNALAGHLDFSNLVETLKNFCVVKYHEHGTLPEGVVDIDFKPDTRVTGMQIQDGHVDNLHLSNVQADLSLTNAQGSFQFENTQITDGHGVLSGNFVLYDETGRLINFQNFDATTNLSGVQVLPDGSVELTGFTGAVDGQATLQSFTAGVTGPVTGDLTQGDISGGMSDGFLAGGLIGRITMADGLELAKQFPSYLVNTLAFGASALKYAYDNRKRLSPITKDLEACVDELETFYKK